MGLEPSPASPIYTCRKSFMKKGQKQVKKKAFKINAKIEDVGLNEDKKVRKQEKVTTFMINQNLKILHTAFPYCTRSSNITRNSVLRRSFDTARNVYCILSDQNTANSTFFMVVRAGTEQEETKSSD